MKNKITKTIGLIVFVMFLQLIIVPKVYADTGDIAVICQYEVPDLKVFFSVEIANDSSIRWANESFPKDVIYNWDSSNYWTKGNNPKYSAKDEFNKNFECPKYVIYNDDNELFASAGSNDDIIFAKDQSHADKIKKSVSAGAHNIEFKGQVVTDKASEKFKRNQSTSKVTLPKSCKCTNSSTSSKVVYSFTIEKSMSVPTSQASINGSKHPVEIMNWNRTAQGLPYIYYNDLLNNDKCPDYVLLAKDEQVWGDKYTTYFSDTINKDSYLKVLENDDDANGGYELKCEEVKNEVPSNSNPKSDIDYYVSNPKVNSNIAPLNENLNTYSCGEGYLTGIPARIPKLGKIIYNFIQILVPIILILLGTFDLVKSITGQKEDEIQKGRQIFIKRLVGAILVFFVFSIAKLAISLIAKNTSTIFDCVDCILRDNESCVEE